MQLGLFKVRRYLGCSSYRRRPVKMTDATIPFQITDTTRTAKER